MIAKPNQQEPPIAVLKDIAMSAVADYFKTPPDRLEKTFHLGGEGVDFVSTKFHERFQNLIFGFDKGMLWWYLTEARDVDALASAVRDYIQELLRT